MSKYRRLRLNPNHTRFVYVDPEAFQTLRLSVPFTRQLAADYLGVSIRTIRNWETGASRIPYPAFKLLRMRCNGVVHSRGWDGWSFRADGALCSPIGRCFHPYELTNIQNVFSMSRMFHQLYQEKTLSEPA